MTEPAVSHIIDAGDLERSLRGVLERPDGMGTGVQMRGRIHRAVGLMLNASGIQARLGEVCELRTPGERSVYAEVVGFERQSTLLTPLGSVHGLSAATEVIPSGSAHRFGVGDALLGRVLDGLGAPMDDGGPLFTNERVSTHAEPPSPLSRRRIDAPLSTGVRAIDAMLTVGIGQRLGIFAPSGVGKSTLLGMIARGAQSDVNVIALIGERGREVREFLELCLPEATRRKTVLVVSTSDRPAMERVKCALVATAVAEYFRDRGKNVLLLVDSLTRFARAQREVGLASGEPPTRRSFPPSTFSVLPQLLERAGAGAHGVITAFYTVLVEGDEESDPIAEEVRSIVDGHIVLSRKQALAGRYPAIDLLASISRVMPQVTTPAHRAAAQRVRELLAKYQEIELLVQIGEYREGSDALGDTALRAHAALSRFFEQDADARVKLERTVADLEAVVGAL